MQLAKPDPAFHDPPFHDILCGFGHVKDRNVAAVAVERERLLLQFRSCAGIRLAA